MRDQRGILVLVPRNRALELADGLLKLRCAHPRRLGRLFQLPHLVTQGLHAREDVGELHLRNRPLHQWTTRLGGAVNLFERVVGVGQEQGPHLFAHRVGHARFSVVVDNGRNKVVATEDHLNCFPRVRLLA